MKSQITLGSQQISDKIWKESEGLKKKMEETPYALDGGEGKDKETCC